MGEDRAAFKLSNTNSLLTIPLRSRFPGGSERKRRGGPTESPHPLVGSRPPQTLVRGAHFAGEVISDLI